MTVAPSLPEQLRSVYLLNCVSTLSTFFGVAFSLPLVMVFVLPDFMSMSRVFRMIDLIVTSYIHGMR